MEKHAWQIMMAAHYKWEKNHGDMLRNQMEWYFNDIYKEETDALINKEVTKRLVDDYGPDGLDVIGVSEEMYVALELFHHQDIDMDVEEFKTELVEEYRELKQQYEQDKEWEAWDVKDELKSIYYNFFNAPEELTVVYNGEVIQEYKND